MVVLYLLMGISLGIIVNHKILQADKSRLYRLFAIQLFFNFMWSIIFFRFHSPVMAFVDIVILWVMILVTIVAFRKVSAVSAILLVPYLLWVSFASVLNFSIWQLNQQ